MVVSRAAAPEGRCPIKCRGYFVHRSLWGHCPAYQPSHQKPVNYKKIKKSRARVPMTIYCPRTTGWLLVLQSTIVPTVIWSSVPLPCFSWFFCSLQISDAMVGKQGSGPRECRGYFVHPYDLASWLEAGRTDGRMYIRTDGQRKYPMHSIGRCPSWIAPENTKNDGYKGRAVLNG